MRLFLLRYPNADATPGDLIISRKVYAHTLEDIVQPTGIKIPGKTAIPAGTYSLILTMSKRFGKILPEILEVPAFTGIRIHGGNSTADTSGCILCAYNIISRNIIQGSAVDDLVAFLRMFEEEKTLTVINGY
jgi:hypothetical protein